MTLDASQSRQPRRTHQACDALRAARRLGGRLVRGGPLAAFPAAAAAAFGGVRGAHLRRQRHVLVEQPQRFHHLRPARREAGAARVCANADCQRTCKPCGCFRGRAPCDCA